MPAILGIDLAGIVDSVGTGVAQFHRGDEVYGMAGGVGGLKGSLAEFISADANLLARKPANFAMREAAALPLISITAWEGLVDRAAVQQGQKVLIHGGAGGVGHIAVQLARAFGAQVFATGSAKDRADIEQLGATFIDYKETPALTLSTIPSEVPSSTPPSMPSHVLDMSSARSAGEPMRSRHCRSVQPAIPACLRCCRC